MDADTALQTIKEDFTAEEIRSMYAGLGYLRMVRLLTLVEDLVK